MIDIRVIFFQADPFASLGDPHETTHDLLFVEEIAQYTNMLPKTPHQDINIGESGRYNVDVNPCYGKNDVKAYQLMYCPILCLGTMI